MRKLIQFQIDEAKFNRLKTITIIEGKTIREIMTDLLDEKLAKYPDDERIKKFLQIPPEERLSRILSQQEEGVVKTVKEHPVQRKPKIS